MSLSNNIPNAYLKGKLDMIVEVESMLSRHKYYSNSMELKKEIQRIMYHLIDECEKDNRRIDEFVK